MAHIQRYRDEPHADLSSAEWGTVRLALQVAGVRFREHVAALKGDPSIPRLAQQFARQADDCDKLIEFIDGEGLA